MSKRSISALVLAGLLSNTNVQAEEGKVTEASVYPERKLSLNLGTIYTYENNDLAWFSLHQLLGRGNDYLGIEQEGDKNIWGRIGLMTASLYFARGINYYQHETAHQFRDSERDFAIHPTEWFGYWTSPYPRYEHLGPLTSHDESTILKSLVDGLNQDYYSGYTTWKDSTIKREFTFQEGIYFLTHQLEAFEYTIVSNSSLSFKKRDVQSDGAAAIEYDDVHGYLEGLQKKGISLEYADLFGQTLLADALSWHTWESFYSVYNYLINGERTTASTSISLTNNLKITPPLFSLYFTPQGSFLDANLLVFHGEKAIQFNIGSDLDYAGGGELNTFRMGGEVRSIPFQPLEVIPFGYVDLERNSFAYQGSSTGLEMLLHVTSTASVRAKWEYDHHDTLENGVKGKAEGNNFVLGIEVEI